MSITLFFSGISPWFSPLKWHHILWHSHGISATLQCFNSTTPTLGHLILFWLTQLTSTYDERNSYAALISFSDPWNLVGCYWARKAPAFSIWRGEEIPSTLGPMPALGLFVASACERGFNDRSCLKIKIGIRSNTSRHFNVIRISQLSDTIICNGLQLNLNGAY